MACTAVPDAMIGTRIARPGRTRRPTAGGYRPAGLGPVATSVMRQAGQVGVDIALPPRGGRRLEDACIRNLPPASMHGAKSLETI